MKNSATEHFLLNEECRREREALLPLAHQFIIDLGTVVHRGKLVSVSMRAIQKRWQPQLSRAVNVLDKLLTICEHVDAIYVTGEGRELPMVVRRLKEAFGALVCRAASGRATTATGLAIAADPKTNFDLWMLPLLGDRKPVPYLATEFRETNAQFSPDGKWIAYRLAHATGTALAYNPVWALRLKPPALLD
jgi:hypothetical protein